MAADLLSQPGSDDPGQLSGKTGVGTVFFGDVPFLHDELERIWKETGRTIVFVTHNVREAVRLGQRVLLLSSRPGRVVQEWNVTEEHRTDAGLAGQLTGVITARLREEIRRHAK
jgi:NitT/TauT family transport system ATP-binding protein